MHLFNKRYAVNFRSGRRRRLAAQNILELVKRDSKSDYNWFASSEELVRICKLLDFPQDVAILIEAAILNCYANIENSVRICSDDECCNVAYCYNSLIDYEEYESLRKKYISAVLSCVINYGLGDEPRLFPIGKTYEKMRFEWKEKNVNSFVSSRKKISDLDKLFQIFNEDFESMIREADEKGVFDKDEQEFFNSQLNNISSWTKILKMNDYYPDPDQIR